LGLLPNAGEMLKVRTALKEEAKNTKRSKETVPLNCIIKKYGIGVESKSIIGLSHQTTRGDTQVALEV